MARPNPAPQAQADAAGSVTGLVTGPDAKPLAGVGVEILVDSDGTLDPDRIAYTDGTGVYTFSDVAAGDYSLRFWADGFASVYWGGVPVEKAAASFAVADGSVSRNVQLAAAATISGTLTTTNDDPIANASVQVSWHDPDSDTDYALDSTVQSGSDGLWTITNLVAGTYSAKFSASGYLSEWYDSQTDQADATPIVLAAGETKQADASLTSDGQPPATGNVSGTVRGGGSGLAHVLVTLYRAEGEAGAPTFHKVDSTRSDVDGTYSFTEVADGTYSLFFDDSSGYLDRWLGGFADSAKAVTFKVIGAVVVADDIDLPLGAKVSGLIRGDDGPLSGASVTLYTSCGHGCTNWKASTATGADGHYTFTGLEDDVYTLSVSATGYVNQWFGGSFYQAAAQTFATATASTVLPDVQLLHGGSISGTVTGGAAALASVGVELYGSIPGGQYFTQISWASTDSLGQYSFANLPDGVFTLRVYGSGNYVTQWLGGATGSATATRLTIANKSAITQDVQLTTGGSVAGTVSQDGTPVSETIYLYSWNSGAADYVSSTSAVAGSYSFTGLATGDYTLGVYRSGTWTWLGGATDSSAAQKFTISAPATTAQDFVLTTTAVGSVSGVVTAGGAAQSGAYVNLYKFSGGYASYMAYSYADSAGRFSFAGLADGDYTLYSSGSDDYGQQYLGGTWSSTTATRFTIASANSVTQDFALVRGQTVTGTVTGDNGPLANVEVQLYAPGVYLTSTSTAKDGAWSIHGVLPGIYTVQFSNAGAYQSAWLGGVTGSDDADTFTVPSSDPIVADIQLVRGGTVSGTISGADGGLGSVQVQLNGSSNGYYSSVYTNYDGTYLFRGLADGTYTLQVYGAGGYISTTTSAFTIEGANSVVRDVQLTKGGTVSGIVTGGGAGLANVSIQLDRWWAGGQTEYVAGGQTSADGTYSLAGLADGTYTLYFYGTGNYVGDWLGGVADSADAQTFTISHGNTVVQNEALTLGGTVTGTVTGGGSPVANSYVTLYDADGDQVASTATTASGVFTIGGVRAGTYTLHFGGVGAYVGQWLGGASSRDQASTFTVTAGGTVTRDTQLLLGGSVSGSVSGGGTALKGAEVTLYRLYAEGGYTETDWVSSTQTDASGGYRLVGLEPGTYSLLASANGYVEAWLGGASDAESATTFTITASEALTGRDLDLTKAATVTGTVTGAHGEGVADVEVEVWRHTGRAGADYTDGYEYETYVSTDSDGTYSIGNLPPGSYKLEFGAWNTDYVTEWWDGKYSETAADTITLTSGQTRTENATLGTGVTVTGHATEAGGAALPADTEVELQRWSTAGNDWYEDDSTELATDGSYSFTRLTPGDTYRIVTRPFGRDYASGTFTKATEGAVTMDLAVPSGAWVSGRVLDENGAVVHDADVAAWDRAGRSVGLVSWNGDTFTVKGLFQGGYTLSTSSSGVPDRFLGGATTLKTATFLTLTGTERLTGKDIVYATGATIAGAVTDVASDSPLEGVEVSLMTRNGAVVAATETAADGTYSLRRVPSGIYALWFEGEGDHLGQWWGGEPGSAGAAGYFTVTTGTLTRDLALSSPGSITGVLSGFGSYAYLYLYQRTADGSLDEIDDQEVYGDGTPDSFSFDGLASGGYYLRLYVSALGRSYWWPSAPTSDSAEVVTVTAGQGTNLGELTPPSSGSGVVKGSIATPAGVNWSGAYVELDNIDGSSLGFSDSSIAGGAYEITGVPAGMYLVRLHYDHGGSYVSDSWYPGSLSSGAATPIAVGDRATVIADLTVLATTVSLTGTVRGPSGELVSGAEVELYASSSTDPFADRVSETETDAHGRYAFNSELVSGQAYSLRVDDDNETYLTSYYGGDSYDTAGSFIAGTVTTLDMTMRAPGHVAGTVTAADGSTVGGIRVHLIPTAGGDEETATTDEDGTYTIDWLRPGNYTVRFGGYSFESGDDDCDDDCGPSSYNGQGVLAPLWYDAASTPSTARTIAVQDGATVTGIDGSLGLAGELSGAVSGLVGGKTSWLDVAIVTLYTADGEELAQTTAGANGAPGGYSFSVPAGSYKLCAAPPVGYTGSMSCAGSASSRLRSLIATLTKDPIGQAGSLRVSAGQELDVNDLELGDVEPTTISGPVPTITLGGQSVVTAEVGDTLTAAAGTWSPAGVTLSYGWTVAGVAVGSGASYVVTAADAGKTVKVTVTATGDGLGSQEKTSGGVTISDVTQVFAQAPKPSISGNATVGSTLTAAVGTWDPAPSTTQYRWFAGASPISGATGETYVLTGVEAGQQISVEVTGRKAGYRATSKTSDPTLMVLDFTGGAAPSITGTAKVGQTLTASPGAWPGNGTLVYQWRSGGTSVGADSSTYVPAASDVGKAITVTVTWSKAGYLSVPRTSSASAAVVAAETPRLEPGTVTINNTSPRVGQTITATASGWPPGASVAFQWQRDGRTVATGAAYTVAADDKDKVLTVIATGAKDGYQPATTSASTAAVAGADFTSAPVPAVSGRAVIGQRLTATVGSWSPTPASLVIQWLRGGSPIPGATKVNYTVVAADAGLKVSVQVTASTAGYNTVVKASSPTAAVPYLGKTKAATPKISGTAKVSKTLKAKPGTWKPKGFSFTYQWLRSGVAISGATKASYKLTPSDKGRKLVVKVTGKKAGYATVTKASKATGKVK